MTIDLPRWITMRRAQARLHPHLADDQLDAHLRAQLERAHVESAPSISLPDPAVPEPKTELAAPPMRRPGVRRPSRRRRDSFVDRLAAALRREVQRRLRAG